MSTCAIAPKSRGALLRLPAASPPTSCASSRSASGADPRVSAIDITEIDATADAPDGRTVRLAALLVLEAAAGLAARADGA